MGLVLQKLLGGSGPIVELGDNSFQCCNEEVHSSSSSDSFRTHASAHVDTARGIKDCEKDEKHVLQLQTSEVVNSISHK